MKISFCDFWGGFQEKNNILYHILDSLTDFKVIPLSDQTDVLFYSCYGNSHVYTNRQKTKKIFWPGENIRPNFNECDFSLSFDFDSYNNRNCRFPLWLTYIDFFNKKTYVNQKYLLPVDYVLFPKINNTFFKTTKTQECCILTKHLKNRKDELLNSLASKITVHGFGSYFNNGIPDGEDIKMNLISNYKFHICFENSLYPGYYTEKLLHAKAAGTIPIYYADQRICEDFNPDGFLNLYDYKNINDFIDFIVQVNTNSNLYNNILNTPLFKTFSKPFEVLNDVKYFFNKNILI